MTCKTDNVLLTYFIIIIIGLELPVLTVRVLIVFILFLFLIDELFSTIQHNTNNFESERLKIAFFSEHPVYHRSVYSVLLYDDHSQWATDQKKLEIN